jgi:hypothetical protein
MSQAIEEARIILTLQAYNADPNLSLRRAAFLYNVHFQTLHHRAQSRQARVDCIPNGRKLSNQEEEVIIEYILSLDAWGFPSQYCDIKEIANYLLAERDVPPVSKRWAINFTKRQPELKMHSFYKYDYCRAKCEDLTVIRNWFRLIQNIITKYGICLDDI